MGGQDAEVLLGRDRGNRRDLVQPHDHAFDDREGVIDEADDDEAENV